MAWPLVAVIAVVVLRKPVTTWLTHHPPKKLKAGPVEVEWEQVIARTEQAVKAELPGETPPGGAPSLREELAPDVEQAPLVAIEEAFATVERELRSVVGPVDGVDTSAMGPVALARLGEREGRISRDVARSVEGLGVMRNLAVHGRAPDLTTERAQEYLALADGALYALRHAANKNRS